MKSVWIRSGKGINQEQQQEKRRYRFRPYNRLRKSRDFELVAKEGLKRHNEYLVINYRDRGDNKATRLGIITTRRLGKATRRNRLRRLVREAFRLSLSDIKRGFDIVVVVREKAKNCDSKTIFSSFRSLVKDAGILKDAHSHNNR